MSFPCRKCLKHGTCTSEEALAGGRAAICSPAPNTPSWLVAAEAIPYDPSSTMFTHNVGKHLGPNIELVLSAVREHFSLHPDKLEDVTLPDPDPNPDPAAVAIAA